MIIDEVRIEFLGWGNVRLSWTGDTDAVAHVFVNGRAAADAVRTNAAAKSVVVGVPDPFTVEIHEFAPPEVPPEAPDIEVPDIEAVPASIPLERRPIVWWSAREGADRYRVFHRPDGGAERTIGHVAHSIDARHHAFRAPIDLREDGKRWGFLRVEAVGDSGEQSVRAPWPLFVAALPAKPVNVSASGGGGSGGGVFDLQLEVSS